MAVVGTAAASRNQVPLGIAYMAGSTAMFAGGNAVVKWQLAAYPLGEVAFGRTLFAFLTVAAIVLPHAGWRVLRTRRYREHLQRGLSQFGSMVRVPHWGDALMVALAGIGNGIAQFWWTRSLSLAPPSAVAPFNYLSLVWAMILGFAVWGDAPSPGLLVGSAIVVASGLYILWRETVRRRRAVPAPQRG
jgi:drug/metabolite transporter (DMT)-like permease